MTASLVLDPRFNGPPGSANGGYAAGMLARAVAPDAAVVEVTLRLPPPLGVALEVRDGALVGADGAIVATARPLEDLDVGPLPPPVGLDAARDAGSRGLSSMPQGEHPFPTCFGCGPLAPPDALHNLAGTVAGRPGIFAVDWTPDPSLPARDGRVDVPMVWAAMDCPSATPILRADSPPTVLGRIAVRIDGPVTAGHPYGVTAWALRRDGRKGHAAAALHDADGVLVALARATWIALG